MKVICQPHVLAALPKERASSGRQIGEAVGSVASGALWEKITAIAPT